MVKRKLSDCLNLSISSYDLNRKRLFELNEKIKWEKDNNKKIVQAFERNFNQKIIVVYEWLKRMNLSSNIEISVFPKKINIIIDEDKCVAFLKDFMKSRSKNLKCWRKNNYLKGRVCVWRYLLHSVDLWAKQVALRNIIWHQQSVYRAIRAKLWLEIQNCPLDYNTRHVKIRSLPDRRLILMNQIVSSLWNIQEKSNLVLTLQNAISCEIQILKQFSRNYQIEMDKEDKDKDEDKEKEKEIGIEPNHNSILSQGQRPSDKNIEESAYALIALRYQNNLEKKTLPHTSHTVFMQQQPNNMNLNTQNLTLPTIMIQNIPAITSLQHISTPNYVPFCLLPQPYTIRLTLPNFDLSSINKKI